ncbi:MAG: hypothetical protein ACRECY_16975, partial [Phyllobacterium sp.]
FTPGRAGSIIPNSKVATQSTQSAAGGGTSEIIVRSYFDDNGNFASEVSRIADGKIRASQKGETARLPKNLTVVRQRGLLK